VDRVRDITIKYFNGILPDYPINQPNNLSINPKISWRKGETNNVLDVTQLE
jgi:hypothetical protein